MAFRCIRFHPNCSRKLRELWYKHGLRAVYVPPDRCRAGLVYPELRGAPLGYCVLAYLPVPQAVGATFPTAKSQTAPHGTRTFHVPPLPGASMTNIYIDRAPKSRTAATWVETKTAGHPRRHPRCRLQ